MIFVEQFAPHTLKKVYNPTCSSIAIANRPTAPRRYGTQRKEASLEIRTPLRVRGRKETYSIGTQNRASIIFYIYSNFCHCNKRAMLPAVFVCVRIYNDKEIHGPTNRLHILLRVRDVNSIKRPFWAAFLARGKWGRPARPFSAVLAAPTAEAAMTMAASSRRMSSAALCPPSSSGWAAAASASSPWRAAWRALCPGKTRRKPEIYS